MWRTILSIKEVFEQFKHKLLFGLFAFPSGFELIVDDFRRNSFGPARLQSTFELFYINQDLSYSPDPERYEAASQLK